MITSNIIRCVMDIPNNITKTKSITIDFNGDIKLYG